jgi:hypothetical protein
MASFSDTNHHRLTNHGPNIVTTTSHSSGSMTHHTTTTHKLQSLAAVATVLLQRYHQDDVGDDDDSDENDNKENDHVPPLNYHDTIMTGTSSLKCQFRQYHPLSASQQPRTNTNRTVLGSLPPEMRSVLGPTTEPPPRRAMENAGRDKDTNPTRRTTSIASENDENDDHHEEEEEDDTEVEDEDSAVESVHFSTNVATEHENDDDKVDEDETPFRPTTEYTTMTTATSATPYYYMDKSWIPMTTINSASTGGSRSRPLSKQVSPNTIRVQIRQYMTEHPEKRKTKLLADLGVNSNSFRKFMDPHNYKEPWRAGTCLSGVSMYGPDPTTTCLVVVFSQYRLCSSTLHSGKWYLFGRRTILGSGTGPSASERYHHGPRRSHPRRRRRRTTRNPKNEHGCPRRGRQRLRHHRRRQDRNDTRHPIATMPGST